MDSSLANKYSVSSEAGLWQELFTLMDARLADALDETEQGDTATPQQRKEAKTAVSKEGGKAKAIYWGAHQRVFRRVPLTDEARDMCDFLFV